MYSFVPEAVQEGYRCVGCASVLGADALVHETSGDIKCGACASSARGEGGGSGEDPVFHKAPKLVYALLDALPVVCDACGATEVGGGDRKGASLVEDDMGQNGRMCGTLEYRWMGPQSNAAPPIHMATIV